jgi:hypothetical protein
MKKFKIFLIVTMILAISGVNFLPEVAMAWTPSLISTAFTDYNHDGTIDRLKVVFDSEVTSCNFEADDWTIGSGSVGLTGPTGILNGAGVDADCNGTTNYFYLLVSGSTGTTGYPGTFIPADIKYKNQGALDSITVLGVGVPEQPLMNIDDNASPVIISTVPEAAASGVDIFASYVRVTFSEPMETGITSISISEGVWGPPLWSSDNKTITRSRLLSPPYDMDIIVSAIGEDKNGYLVASGNSPAVSNPWSFRTATDPSLIVSASSSTLTASPITVAADGSSISVIIATVKSSSGAALSGKAVTLSSNRGATDTVVVVNGTTDADGKAYFQVRSNTAGGAIFTAVADGVTISQTASISFTSTSTLNYGDLFKEAGSTAVYYYANNGKRYVFPTQAVYFSWYSDFSAIKTVSHSVVTSVSLGGNVLVKPGTYLVQFVSMDTPFRVLDPKVYVLTATGQLRWITSASTAASLYGTDWERKIIAVPEVYKTNYGGAVAGADVNGTADYNKASIEATARTISDLY